MTEVSLQFQAESSVVLHWVLLGCVSAVLVGYAVWQFARSRYRLACVSLAAAAGAIAPALVIDGLLGRLRRRGGPRARSMGPIPALAAAAGTAGVVAVILLLGDSPQAVWLAILAFQVAAAVGVLYAAVYAYLGPGRIAALMALRCGAIAALMLILFKPAIGFLPHVERTRRVLPVLVDSSGSMLRGDQANKAARYDHAVALLGDHAERLEEHFVVEWRHFGAALREAESVEDLVDFRITDPAEGTDIAGAVTGALRGHSRDNLAGVLLITDGLHNAPSSLDKAVREAPGPIYTAGTGALKEPEAGPEGSRNIEIVSIDAPLDVSRNEIATLNVKVRMKGFKGQDAQLQFIDDVGGEPKQYTLRAENHAHVEVIPVKWRPADNATTTPMGAGRSEVRRLKLTVPVVAGEATGSDNHRDLHVLVTQPGIRVLYIEGAIRPEYKFLRRRIDSDPDVQFLGMVRVSETSFWSYGSIDGQRLDQLPRTDKDFALFDVLILGDLDASFLTRQRMARIRKFVEDGGGLVMMGGHRSFGPGGYGGTDIEAVLPVVVGQRGQPQDTTEFLPLLTAAGQDHPIFAGLVDCLPTPARARPKDGAVQLRNLLGCVTVVKAKDQAGAELLAVHPARRNDAGPLVVLAVQQVGKGRTAALTADTTWRWYMPMRAVGADGPYQRFWAQLIRWLAHVDTRTREAAPSVVLRQDRAALAANQPVRLTARVQQGKGAPAGQTTVKLTVLDDDDKTVATAQLLPTDDREIFATTYRPTADGAFRLKVAAVDTEGKELGADELPLTVATPANILESKRTARDVATLEKIAAASGGIAGKVSRLGELVDHLIAHRDTRPPEPEQRIVKLFYLFGDAGGFAGLFVILVALLTTEWLLRRRWQLH